MWSLCRRVWTLLESTRMLAPTGIRATLARRSNQHSAQRPEKQHAAWHVSTCRARASRSVTSVAPCGLRACVWRRPLTALVESGVLRCTPTTAGHREAEAASNNINILDSMLNVRHVALNSKLTTPKSDFDMSPWRQSTERMKTKRRQTAR